MGVLWGLLIAGFVCLSLPLRADQPITIHLVPEARWSQGNIDPGDLLSEGTVRLYRQGRETPDLVRPLGQPFRVPAGRWLWVAEAPGWITTSSGVLTVPSTPAPEQTLIWPAVPACRLTLGPPPAWRGIERLDLVSLDRNAVFPVAPRKRREVQIPAGRWLAYGTGPRGLVGITRPRRCRSGKAGHLATIAPPPGDRQEILATARLPDETDDRGEGEDDPGTMALEELEVSLGPPAGPGQVHAPAAVVRIGSRVSAFFLDLPADGATTPETRRLELRHPELRTLGTPVATVGGQALELSELALLPRRRLELAVDYRPAIPHRSAEIVLTWCSLRKDSNPYRDVRNCPGDPRTRALTPGPQRFVFEDLDDGQYLLEARIDGDIVRGLGAWLAPWLDPDPASTEDLHLGPVPLVEETIYGHLLDDGEPVAGEVRLLPLSEGLAPVRRFPTDEELIYRLRYFGHRTRADQLDLPDQVRRRLDENSRGLYLLHTFEACDREGFCLPWNSQSSLTGSGRLDISLGDGRRVEVMVTDQERQALPGAMVIIPRSNSMGAFHYIQDQLFTHQAESMEGRLTLTDSAGIARLRLERPGIEELPLAVTKRGYERYRGRVPLLAGETTHLAVVLQPEATGGDLQLRVAGEPAGRAFLLGYGRDGGSLPQCSALATREGWVSRPRGCEEVGRWLVFHPSAALVPLSPVDLRQRTLDLPPLAGDPIRLRLLDGDGAPVPRTAVTVSLDDLRVVANDLLLVVTRAGWLPWYLSDEDGRLALPGIDPRRATIEVWASPLGSPSGTEPPRESLSLAGTSPGEEVPVPAGDH